MQVRISDLWDCAYLVWSKIEISHLEVIGHNGKRSVYFIFDGGKAAQLHQEFIEGKAFANVTQLKLIMNHLKDLLFNKLRENPASPEGYAATGGRKENEKHRQKNYNRSQRDKQHC